MKTHVIVFSRCFPSFRYNVVFSVIMQMCLPEEEYVLLETTNAAGLPLSEVEIGLQHLYQSDVPILGQETEIHGLLPGQLGVVLEMNSVEYIFFTNQAAADEYENILNAEAEVEAQNVNVGFDEQGDEIDGDMSNNVDSELNETWVISDVVGNADNVWDLDETLIIGEYMSPEWSEWSNSDSVSSQIQEEGCVIEYMESDRNSFDFYF